MKKHTRLYSVGVLFSFRKHGTDEPLSHFDVSSDKWQVSLSDTRVYSPVSTSNTLMAQGSLADAP